MPVVFHARRAFNHLRPIDEEGADALRGVRDGEVVKLTMTRPSARSIKMHNKFFALLRVAGAQIDWNENKMLAWSKIAVGHVEPMQEPNTGAIILRPLSISFQRMDQRAFQDFFERAVDAILTRLLPAGTSREAFIDEVTGEVNERYAP